MRSFGWIRYFHGREQSHFQWFTDLVKCVKIGKANIKRDSCQMNLVNLFQYILVNKASPNRCSVYYWQYLHIDHVDVIFVQSFTAFNEINLWPPMCEVASQCVGFFTIHVHIPFWDLILCPYHFQATFSFSLGGSLWGLNERRILGLNECSILGLNELKYIGT